MDTEAELAQDAATPDRPVEYACCIEACTSATVPEPDDLNRCENCAKRICQGHTRQRSFYVLCSECDDAERMRLLLLIAEPLEQIAAQIRQRTIDAEQAQLKLLEIADQVAEIQGGK